MIYLKILFLSLFILSNCVSIPDKIKPVENFQLDRYLGKWHEIARLDHSFERGLSKVSAEYILLNDNSVQVINQGYNDSKSEWKKAKGIAYFVENKEKAFLKVSFFRPFYGSYIVIDLDNDYKYSMVCGPNKNYLWILSRTPKMDEVIKAKLIDKAKQLGFETDKLIFPNN